MSAMLLRVVEGDPGFTVLSGRDKLSQPEQGVHRCPVGLQKETGVLHALGQGEELLCRLARCLVFCSYCIKRPQPKQRREEL